jgi:tetratricopeptide (TPR) repeat protein
MSKPQLKLALEICNTNPSEELVALRDDVLHNLGAVEKSTNNVTMSLEYTTRRLDYRLQALKDGEQPDVRVASAYNEHGLSCMLNGRPEQAVEHFLTSIRYYKELEDYQLAMDNNPRMNLGFAYWATAQLDKGLEYLEQLLEDRVIRFGPHDSESFR